MSEYGTKQRPIGLSDRALALVQRHAAALPADQRDVFLQDVAAWLTDDPSDDTVAAAVNVVLDPSRCMTDASTT
jgi:hypothetical protein